MSASQFHCNRVLLKNRELTEHFCYWTVRQAAQATGISKSAVHRLFQAFALQPHRTRSFKLSTDPFFIEKVCDIVGLYLNPDADAALGWFSFRFRENEFFGQFLARLEARIAFCRYSDCLAGPGITTLTLFFVFHCEAAKASKIHPFV